MPRVRPPRKNDELVLWVYDKVLTIIGRMPPSATTGAPMHATALVAGGGGTVISTSGAAGVVAAGSVSACWIIIGGMIAIGTVTGGLIALDWVRRRASNAGYDDVTEVVEALSAPGALRNAQNIFSRQHASQRGIVLGAVMAMLPPENPARQALFAEGAATKAAFAGTIAAS